METPVERSFHSRTAHFLHSKHGCCAKPRAAGLRTSVALDRIEFRVDPHAFTPDLVRSIAESLRSEARSGIAVHLLDGAPDVLGSRQAQRVSAAARSFQQVFWKLE